MGRVATPSGDLLDDLLDDLLSPCAGTLRGALDVGVPMSPVDFKKCQCPMSLSLI